MKRGRPQVVTGLTVFDKTQPRIPKNIKRKIRMACYLLSQIGPDDYDENVPWCKLNYLHSILTYYDTIEPYFVDKMLKFMK
jgi:hypothetical protein